MYQLMYYLRRAIDLYETLILIGVIMSWIPRKPGSTYERIYDAIRSLIDPYLNIFRGIIPPLGGSGVSIDFSPVIGIIVLDLVKRIL